MDIPEEAPRDMGRGILERAQATATIGQRRHDCAGGRSVEKIGEKNCIVR